MRITTLSTSSALVLAASVFAGCGGGGGGGGGFAASTVAGATSATPTTSSSGPTATTAAGIAVSTSQPVGPLHRKALDFEASMQAMHVPHGLVQDVKLDASGQTTIARSGPSRCLWTGVYAATEAARFRATSDPQAQANMERALWALHDLAQITGVPGAFARGFDDPSFQQGPAGAGTYSAMNYDAGKPSRDQYTGWFYGVGMAWESITDPALRAALAADARPVCDALMQHDLVLQTTWNGAPDVTLMDLNANGASLDNVTAQTWATVDDFPLNLIVKVVPYDPALVTSLRQAATQLPPIRAGEAVRALLIFTVAERITGDARYGQYKRDLAFGAKNFHDAIRDYMLIQDDLLLGRNQVIARDALVRTFRALGIALQGWLQSTGRWSLVAPLAPIVVQGLGNFLATLAIDVIDAIHDPNNQQALARVALGLRLFGAVFNLVGMGSVGQSINNFATRYASNLNHAGLVELSKVIRGYLTVNLTLMPLAALSHLETDPSLRDLYLRSLEGHWVDMGHECNCMINALHAGYGYRTTTHDVPDLMSELGRFPTDLRMRKFDNTGRPGVVPSVWPDRFGNATMAGAPDFFHIDERAPDIFGWRGNPRQLVSGSDDPSTHVAPLGYLAPYWMARDRGLIGPAD